MERAIVGEIAACRILVIQSRQTGQSVERRDRFGHHLCGGKVVVSLDAGEHSSRVVREIDEFLGHGVATRLAFLLHLRLPAGIVPGPGVLVVGRSRDGCRLLCPTAVGVVDIGLDGCGDICRAGIAGRQHSTKIVECVGHLRPGGRGARQLARRVKHVRERVDGRAARHPLFLSAPVQVVVRVICDAAIAVSATGQISRGVVSQ